MSISIPIIGNLIDAVSGYFQKKQEIKAASATAKVKLESQKISGQQSLELTDAEWEAISANTQNNSWKDEYVTIIITSPIVLILLGSVFAALGYSAGSEILKGTLSGISELKNLGMDFGLLMNAVVFAAVGLKLWRA